MKTSEIIVFIVYLLCMLGIGIFFFVKNRNGGEKTYFLGGREMGPWVAALSAGASDMSAWVLMGLPTSIYALGLGQVWIPVGLAIGYTISWLLEAPRLRKFSIVANDSITIPQYLTNRFLSIKSQKDLKKSAKIGITWTLLIVFFATLIGVIGRLFLGFDESINENSLVFIQIVRKIFPGVISGILLSAVLAASMSTADSQLLAASSAFSSDVYKPVIRKGKASDKEMMWTGRIVVLGISVAALIIASNPNAGSIMALVSNAWGIFGAAFGPAIMLSLFWKRFNFKGAVAGIITGAAVDILWYAFLSSTGIYELLPGFVLGLIAAVVVTLCTNEPSKEVYELFDKAEKFDE